MTETVRDFHLGDLLTVTTGHLLSPRGVDGLYDIIDFVTGVPHYTHQLPRGADAVRPWLLEQHPWLADVVVPESALESEATVLTWLATATAEHGEKHPARAMPEGAYVGRNPFTELAEMAPDAEIVVVVVDPDGGGR